MRRGGVLTRPTFSTFGPPLRVAEKCTRLGDTRHSTGSSWPSHYPIQSQTSAVGSRHSAATSRRLKARLMPVLKPVMAEALL